MEVLVECEIKRLFKIDGETILLWRAVQANAIADTAVLELRCAECHGPVTLRKRKGPDDPPDHVEHVRHEDSVGCRAGAAFDGTHRRSLTPVE
jgi:hypothetical protein